jgi:hypothetical protein
MWLRRVKGCLGNMRGDFNDVLSASATLGAFGDRMPAGILISNSFIKGIRTLYLSKVSHKCPVFLVTVTPPLRFLLLIVRVLTINEISAPRNNCDLHRVFV